MTRGITILDRDPLRNTLRVGLRELAHSLPFFTDRYEWELRALECVGPTAEELHRTSEARARVQGSHLARLASPLTQIIEGELFCFEPGSNQVEAVIRFVDSSAVDVLCDRLDVLAAVRLRFTDVVDLPPEGS